jgi:hypothetical protein
MKVNGPLGQNQTNQAKPIEENDFNLDVREFRSSQPGNLGSDNQLTGTTITTTTVWSVIKYTLLVRC